MERVTGIVLGSYSAVRGGRDARGEHQGEGNR
jgi:hypothetical protein